MTTSIQFYRIILSSSLLYLTRADKVENIVALTIRFLKLCSWFVLLENSSHSVHFDLITPTSHSEKNLSNCTSCFSYTMRRFTSNPRVTPSRASMIISRKLDDVASFRGDTIPWRSVDRHWACASMCTRDRSVIEAVLFSPVISQVLSYAVRVSDGGRWKVSDVTRHKGNVRTELHGKHVAPFAPVVLVLPFPSPSPISSFFFSFLSLACFCHGGCCLDGSGFSDERRMALGPGNFRLDWIAIGGLRERVERSGKVSVDVDQFLKEI